MVEKFKLPKELQDLMDERGITETELITKEDVRVAWLCFERALDLDYCYSGTENSIAVQRLNEAMFLQDLYDEQEEALQKSRERYHSTDS